MILPLLLRRLRTVAASLVLCGTAGLAFVTSAAAAALDVSPTVTPLSSTEIVNPFRGYMKWSGQETVPHPAASPDSYRRLSWTDLEGSTQGSYNMQPIYDGIAEAKATGGPKAKFSFGIRVMKGGSEPNTTLVPTYVRNLMPKGFYSGTTYIPDWNDADFLTRFTALLQRVAQEFDGSPDIGFFEMNVYGTYGEWNAPHVYPAASGATAATSTTLHNYVDMYVGAFHQTRLVMMTDNEDALVYAMGLTPTGGAPWMGWSRKSLGDSHFSDSGGMTPAKLTAIQNRWQKAPIFGEFFGGDKTNGTTALTQVRNFHVSLVGNGNLTNGANHNSWSDYPSTQQADFVQLGKEAGYRFAISNVKIPETLVQGGAFTVQTKWQNNGLNPAYEPFTVQYQLRSGTTVVQQWNSSIDLEDWSAMGATPTLYSDGFAIAPGTAAGSYSFAVIVTSLDGSRDPIKLAINTARNTDGSYTLGTVTVAAGQVITLDNFDDGEFTTPAWTTSVGTGGSVLFWASQGSWSPATGPDGSAKYVKIEFNNVATFQYAILKSTAAAFGQAWAANGSSKIRFWFKGHASNSVSASSRIRVQFRESDNGERWSYDLGSLATTTTFQQLTLPFSAFTLSTGGTQTAGGTANVLDVSLIDQVRFFDDSNPTALAIYVDRIEIIP